MEAKTNQEPLTNAQVLSVFDRTHDDMTVKEIRARLKDVEIMVSARRLRAICKDMVATGLFTSRAVETTGRTGRYEAETNFVNQTLRFCTTGACPTCGDPTTSKELKTCPYCTRPKRGWRTQCCQTLCSVCDKQQAGSV